jgi:hypothetical protein
MFLITDLAQAGVHDMAITLYDEDGNAVFTTNTFSLTINAPAEPA